jgi:hypothetical protein
MILVPTSRSHIIVVQTFRYTMIAIRIFGYDTYSILKHWAILGKGAQCTSWGQSPSDPISFKYDLNTFPSHLWQKYAMPTLILSKRKSVKRYLSLEATIRATKPHCTVSPLRLAPLPCMGSSTSRSNSRMLQPGKQHAHFMVDQLLICI